MGNKVENKKVLYAITKSSWGGAQRYVFDLASHFKKEGFDVTVCFGRNEFSGENIFKEKLEKENIKTIEIKSLGRDISLFKDFFVFFELLKIFKKERPEIVHLNSSKMVVLGAPAAYFAGVKKLVFTTHGLPFLEERPFWQKQILKLSMFLSFLFVTDIIAVSKLDERILKSWPFVRNKVKLIYNGIKAPSFLSREEARAALATRARVAFPENATLWGTIAELTDNKGILEFLQENHEKIKKENIYYFLIGTGELKEKIKEKIKELGLEPQVFLLGFLPEAGKYLKAFDLFILPSKKEGLPYVLLEVRFAKVPIKASTVGGIPEILSADLKEFEVEKMISETKKVYNIKV